MRAGGGIGVDTYGQGSGIYHGRSSLFGPPPLRVRKLHFAKRDERLTRSRITSERSSSMTPVSGFLCSALPGWEPTLLCLFLHTLIRCRAWDTCVCHFVEPVAKCRYEVPEALSLKRLIITTNVDSPSTEELRQSSFYYIDSLDLRMTAQLPETREEREF